MKQALEEVPNYNSLELYQLPDVQMFGYAGGRRNETKSGIDSTNQGNGKCSHHQDKVC